MTEDILSACFKRSENVVFRKVGDEFVLVPIHKDAVDMEALFSFNETAARIWEMIDGNRSSQAIAENLSREFNCSIENARVDTTEFLSKLQELNFISKVA